LHGLPKLLGLVVGRVVVLGSFALLVVGRALVLGSFAPLKLIRRSKQIRSS
jgi:hypothetical protein